ncbi:ATP-grasp domain-containing protein [Clostridium sp. YIM B02569]|uniref:ATP-grasp domain-containing protein n=1 Tax=Clostridium sp. YIM B02569 TaxID=2911967 RepID=UPI001EEB0909|nr:ATP-grasp domain-containing protein [Clostridium sp. YIM B02569]
MKRKLIIIGANDFQNQLIIKAKERNIETHVFAWKDGDIGEYTADKFYPISIIEKEKILEVARKIKPNGVISIASDLATITVNYVANALNLVANSNECTFVSTNKFEMRKAFEENKIPCPKFIHVTENTSLDELNIDYPVIVKPTDRSGSRGINKVYCTEEMKIAVKEAIEVSFNKEALIEEYVEGREFSIEYISQNGRHNFLAITEKFTTGQPHFIETAHMQPARITKEQEEKIKEIIPKALTALKIENGASHSELKIDENNIINIIEIGGRMGGDCIGSDLVQISTGYDFVNMVIDIAIGEKLKLVKTSELRVAAVKFIFNEEDYNIYKNIKQNHSDKIYRVSEIDQIGSREVTDSSTRFGYFILSCDTVKEVLELLKLGME